MAGNLTPRGPVCPLADAPVRHAARLIDSRSCVRCQSAWDRKFWPVDFVCVRARRDSLSASGLHSDRTARVTHGRSFLDEVFSLGQSASRSCNAASVFCAEAWHWCHGRAHGPGRRGGRGHPPALPTSVVARPPSVPTGAPAMGCRRVGRAAAPTLRATPPQPERRKALVSGRRGAPKPSSRQGGGRGARHGRDCRLSIRRIRTEWDVCLRRPNVCVTLKCMFFARVSWHVLSACSCALAGAVRPARAMKSGRTA